MNDREQLLHEREEREHAERSIQRVMEYDALGMGMARFCQAFYDVLEDDPRFTHAERLRLLLMALHGGR